jgi:hypothetical protein
MTEEQNFWPEALPTSRSQVLSMVNTVAAAWIPFLGHTYPRLHAPMLGLPAVQVGVTTLGRETTALQAPQLEGSASVCVSQPSVAFLLQSVYL